MSSIQLPEFDLKGLFASLVALYYLIPYLHRFDLLGLLPSVSFSEIDIHARTFMFWQSEQGLGSYKATMHQNPQTLQMAWYCRIQDGRNLDDNATHYIPSGITYFWSRHLFFMRGRQISVLWHNNQPIKELVKEIIQWDTNAYLQQKVNCKNSWNTCPPMPKISREALISKTSDEVFQISQKFFQSSEEYASRHQYWRKGILLEGARGTGKTQTAVMTASALCKTLYRFNISSLTDDEFLKLVYGISEGSIVVFDDFEKLPLTHGNSTGKEHHHVSITSLNSFLDGSIGQRGILVFLTVNDAKKLEGSLIRACRIHNRFQFPDEIRPDAVQVLFRRWYGSKTADSAGTKNHTCYGTTDDGKCVKATDDASQELDLEKQAVFPGRTPAQLQEFFESKDEENCRKYLLEWLKKGERKGSDDNGESDSTSHNSDSTQVEGKVQI